MDKVEKQKKASKIYYEKNKDAFRLKQSNYNLVNRDEINAKSKLKYQNNKEKLRLQNELTEMYKKAYEDLKSAVEAAATQIQTI